MFICLVGVLIINGNEGVCDHHREEIKSEVATNRNRNGARIQFIGDKCGIEIYLKGNLGMTYLGYFLTKISYEVFFKAHLMNVCVSTISRAIGIKEWLAPQISEHWP